MKNLRTCCCLLLLLTLAAAAGPYEPTWESLEKVNPAPDWFRDAKVGIYFHWGVYSVPAFGNEWYPRNMHLEGHKVNLHHRETWGEPGTFGYADFVPHFTAEHFDADAWADLFVRAGARFAGPVAEHHDGYAMWDSDWTPWNAADTGPKRDLTGDLEAAIRKRGMRFVATFHHARNSLWEPKPDSWAGHYSGVKQNYPELLEDPRRAILYGYMPRDEFLDMWLGKLKEVIDNYRPDLIWFDSWLNEIPEAFQREFLAYYYNRASAWGAEVVVTRKQNDLPLSVSLEDFEKGRADDLTEHVWLTDDTISKGSWCYTEHLAIKDADEVIDTLVDIVSKNGQLLLNISPRADGTIPDDQRQVLLAMGDWLEVYGEAIYDTRPWLTYGEGPTRMRKGGHFVGYVGYGPQDIRYTRSKDGRTLYAIVLGRPETPEVTLASVAARATGEEARVDLLGHPAGINHRVNDQGQLVLEMSGQDKDSLPESPAYAFRIRGFEVKLSEYAGFERGGITLPATGAVLDGGGIALETRNDDANIGFWDDPGDSAHWLVRIPSPGKYGVRGRFAAVAATRARLEADGRSTRFDIPATGGWSASRFVSAGALTFDRPGVYHLVLRADDPATWNAVNVWELQLAEAD